MNRERIKVFEKKTKLQTYQQLQIKINVVVVKKAYKIIEKKKLLCLLNVYYKKKR